MKLSLANSRKNIENCLTKSRTFLKQQRIIIQCKIIRRTRKYKIRFQNSLRYLFPRKINVKLEVDYLFGIIILEKFHDLETQNIMLSKFDVASNVNEFYEKFKFKRGSEFL